MAPPKKRKPTQPQRVGVASVQRSNKPFIIGGLALLAVVAIIAVIVAVAQNSGTKLSDSANIAEVRPVTVTGTPLAQAPSDGSADPAIGTQAPSLAGESFDGTKVNLANDGKAKAVMFFAHWCPHCQREAPVLQKWIDANASKYPNVEFYSIATGTNPQQANYPPSEWLLDKVKMPGKIIADDRNSPAATAFGLASYPYLVFLNADGTVSARTSGEIGEAAFAQYVSAINTGTSVGSTTTVPAGESSPAS